MCLEPQPETQEDCLQSAGLADLLQLAPQNSQSRETTWWETCREAVLADVLLPCPRTLIPNATNLMGTSHTIQHKHHQNHLVPFVVNQIFRMDGCICAHEQEKRGVISSPNTRRGVALSSLSVSQPGDSPSGRPATTPVRRTSVRCGGMKDVSAGCSLGQQLGTLPASPCWEQT